MWLYLAAVLVGLYLLRRWHRERQAVPRLSEKREVHPFGVQVSIIKPGGLWTGMTNPTMVVKVFRHLWEQPPAETQAAYGHHYLETYAKSSVLLHHLSSSCLSRVTSVMAHALLDRFPHNRYAAGWVARFTLLLRSYCPAWLTDAAIDLFPPVPARGTPARP